MSDEVSQFLEQVERLRGQQIEEDEVRARELEEYMVAKRERQARREGESCLLCSYFPMFPSTATTWLRCCMDGVVSGPALCFPCLWLTLPVIIGPRRSLSVRV